VARYPDAEWHPSPNFTPGNHPRIYVLHIMQGSLAGTDSWFTEFASQAQASAHFGIGKDGRVIQWVDTADQSWNCENGNPVTIGVEHEGFAGEELTGAQIAADEKLAVWCHLVHGIPLTPTNDVNGSGTGWHGMGGGPWGGHEDCPGSPIVAQRRLIDSAAPVAPGKWVTGGKRSLVAIAVNQHMMASTILRYTIQNTPAGFFEPALAGYINGGDLAHVNIPANVTLYLSGTGDRAQKGPGGQEWITAGVRPLVNIATDNQVTVAAMLRETIAHYGTFNTELARYLCAGDLAKTPVPAGAQLWIPAAE